MTFERFEAIAKLIPIWVGMGVALAGLRTWRKQLYGKQEYDVAVRLLTFIFKYRDALQGVRNPFSFVDPSKGVDGQREEYNARWSAVNSARSDLEAELLVAEAIWGTDGLRTPLGSLFALDGRVYGAVLQYLEDYGKSSGNSSNAQETAALRRILFRASSSDAFSVELETAVVEVSSRLRKRLKKFR
jgi:hypothetical protein